MISLNGLELGFFQAKELTKHTARIYVERKKYRKAPSIKQKKQEINLFKTYPGDAMR